MSDAPPLLEAELLRCERNGRALFDAFSLTLRGGEAVWLRGANGSGKTTLLRTLAGLHQPARGRVRRAAPLRYIGHACALKDLLSVAEGLQLAAALDGVSPQGVPAALARMGLTPLARRPSRQLSQGQRRRAALAPLALPQPGPSCWLLDEPFDALDDAGQDSLATLLREHCAGGGALCFTCHQAVAAWFDAAAPREVWLA